jgi:hypothetical protein
VDVAELGRLLQGRGETKAAGVDVLPQQFRKARFVEGRLAMTEPVNLGGIDVHSEDVMAELCHAGGMNCT